jgi:hypothetical protein
MAKRIIPNLYIAVQEGVNFEAIQENTQIKTLIYSNIVTGIVDAKKYNRTEATIVELNSTGNYITIGKEDWKQSLMNVQEYFIQSENYEACSEIQKLIESLNSYESKRLHRKTSRANKPDNRSKKHSKTSKEDRS